MAERKYYRTKQLAALLQVNEMTIRRWVREGKLASKRAGHAILIPESAVDRFIDGMEQESKSAKTKELLRAAGLGPKSAIDKLAAKIVGACNG